MISILLYGTYCQHIIIICNRCSQYIVVFHHESSTEFAIQPACLQFYTINVHQYLPNLHGLMNCTLCWFYSPLWWWKQTRNTSYRYVIAMVFIWPFLYFPFFHIINTLSTFHWRHIERDGASNHQRLNCLLNFFSGADQWKHQSSASLALVRGIHRYPIDSLTKGR